MSDQLPVRKFVRVWLKKRKNPPRNDGSKTVSYTLEWVEYGQRRFVSLGRHANAAYARSERARKEAELNSPEGRETLEPILWADLRQKYLETTYPGHDLPPKERQKASRTWGKSANTFRAERLAIDNFQRIVINAPKRASKWCHEITSADRENFISTHITEVASPESVDADLRTLRTLFNVMEEWNHRSAGSNPFAGRKKATVGARRKRIKEMTRDKSKEQAHYTRSQIVAILNQIDEEAVAEPANWELARLRCLIYFEAYTGGQRDVLRVGRTEDELQHAGRNIDSPLPSADASFCTPRNMPAPRSIASVSLSRRRVS